MNDPKIAFDVPEDDLPQPSVYGQWPTLLHEMIRKHRKNLVIELETKSRACSVNGILRNAIKRMGYQHRLEVHLCGLCVVVLRKEAQK